MTGLQICPPMSLTSSEATPKVWAGPNLQPWVGSSCFMVQEYSWWWLHMGMLMAVGGDESTRTVLDTWVLLLIEEIRPSSWDMWNIVEPNQAMMFKYQLTRCIWQENPVLSFFPLNAAFNPGSSNSHARRMMRLQRDTPLGHNIYQWEQQKSSETPLIYHQPKNRCDSTGFDLQIAKPHAKRLQRPAELQMQQ